MCKNAWQKTDAIVAKEEMQIEPSGHCARARASERDANSKLRGQKWTLNVDEKSGGARKAVVGGRYGDAKCERDGRGDANCKAKCRSKKARAWEANVAQIASEMPMQKMKQEGDGVIHRCEKSEGVGRGCEESKWRWGVCGAEKCKGLCEMG